jgi:hypothetical protein
MIVSPIPKELTWWHAVGDEMKKRDLADTKASRMNAAESSTVTGRRSRVAKRGNPAYKQFSVHVPKDLYVRVKVLMAQNSKTETLGDVVGRALEYLLDVEEEGQKKNRRLV